jgi:HTH-type transcriptional regulator/antitoxin HigA
METTLKYKIITSRKQYNEYCKDIYSLLNTKNKTREINEEIDLLTLLIEKWDSEHNTHKNLDPVELLKALMEEHKLEPNDLMKLLGVSKGMVSGILNYHKGLSKENIQILASHFKIAQEAFNKKYDLKPRLIKVTSRAKHKKRMVSHSHNG